MAINSDDIDAIIEEMRDAWLAALVAEIADAAMEGMHLVDEEIDTGFDFAVFEQRALTYAKEQAGLKITQILESTRAQVQEVIGQAIEGGWSVNETANAIKDLYDGFETSRALTIARTEIASAINWGKYEAAKDSASRLDMQLEKTWSAVHDRRTRPTHAAVDGTTKKLSQAFTVGGSRGMFPGDPNLPASETINCRCMLIYSEASNS